MAPEPTVVSDTTIYWVERRLRGMGLREAMRRLRRVEPGLHRHVLRAAHEATRRLVKLGVLQDRDFSIYDAIVLGMVTAAEAVRTEHRRRPGTVPVARLLSEVPPEPAAEPPDVDEPPDGNPGTDFGPVLDPEDFGSGDDR